MKDDAKLPEPTMSAYVETGATTNRVKAGRPPRGGAPALRRRKKEEFAAGTVVTAISMSPAELKVIDKLACARGLCRSRFLVVAAMSMDLTPEEAELISMVRRMRG